jgi:hypothetical protein
MLENRRGLFERIARALRQPVAVDSSFDERLMNAVRALPRHSRRSALWSRIMRPRTVTVTPLSWGLLAATLLLMATLTLARAFGGSDAESPAAAPGGLFARGERKAAAQPVQFVLVAPAARKVAVVGDFNGWDASHAAYQAHHRGGGVWSVTAAVPAGHHRYSFVVDDSVWMADPAAPRAIDNDYGLPNSAIVVEERNR